MADTFLQIQHYRKEGKTGGGENDMDAIDVTADGFKVGSICEVFISSGGERSKEVFRAEDSGTTANGDTVVMPVNPAGYSGTIRWHQYIPGTEWDIKVVASEPAEGDMEANTLYLVAE